MIPCASAVPTSSLALIVSIVHTVPSANRIWFSMYGVTPSLSRMFVSVIVSAVPVMPSITLLLLGRLSVTCAAVTPGPICSTSTRPALAS